MLRGLFTLATLVAVLSDSALAARGKSLAAFDGRCILAGCVALPSNIPDILGHRALSARRLARLGATPDFHHGLLTKRVGGCVACRGRRSLPATGSLRPPRQSLPNVRCSHSGA